MNRHSRMPRFLLVALAAVVAVGLAGCETKDPVQKLPALTFEHLKPLNLAVARIDVIAEYKPPLKPPHVDHLFPTPPLKAARQWAADRLKAVGRTGSARLVIKEASAVQTALEKKTGFAATFTKQQSDRYDVAIDVTLEVSGPGGGGVATARATRFKTLREDATIHERDRMWLRLTEDLMRDFDAEMEKNIRQYLVNWLR